MPDLITADHATRAWREDGIEPGARRHDIPASGSASTVARRRPTSS